MGGGLALPEEIESSETSFIMGSCANRPRLPPIRLHRLDLGSNVLLQV